MQLEKSWKSEEEGCILGVACDMLYGRCEGRAGKGACEEAREEDQKMVVRNRCLEMGLLILKNKKEMPLT